MTREEAYNRIDAIIARHEIDDVYVTITNYKDYDALRMAREILEQEPCDCISRAELLKAMDTWDKFGSDAKGLIPLRTPALQDRYVPYVHYDDVAKAIKGMPSIQPTTKENLVVGDCISRQAVLDLVEDMTDQFGVEHRVITEGVISMLPPVTPKTNVLEKIKAEIKEWYWQADKQALAKDPCVVDAMIDLFIRTINKYKAESEDEK